MQHWWWMMQQTAEGLSRHVECSGLHDSLGSSVPVC